MMNPGWLVVPEEINIINGGGGGTGVPLNYVQNVQISPTTILFSDSLPATIITATITTLGNPVQIIVSGDANRTDTGPGWGRLQLFRGNTAIGNVVHFESTEANINIPYCLELIDPVSPAGTYVYSLRLVGRSVDAVVQFGEVNGPVMSLL